MQSQKSLRQWLAGRLNARDGAKTASRRAAVSNKRREQLQIERLENRILMAADPLSFIAQAGVAHDVTLSFKDAMGIVTITDTYVSGGASKTDTIEKALADITTIDITLSAQNDKITIANDFSALAPVTINGAGGADTLVGPSAGAAFMITGANAGSVAGATFTNISKVVGADNAADSFTISAGAALSGSATINGIDGGVGGSNTIYGPATGGSFLVSGPDAGIAAGISFTHVGRLQGAANAADAFTVAAGGALSAGLDGGTGGGNTLTAGPGAQITISGPDGGAVTVGTGSVAFGNIGQLTSAAGAPSRFQLGAGASLSNGIVGHAGDTLFGPLGGASFTITGTDAGTAAGVSFQGVSKLVGGTGSDVFTFGAAGRMSGGIDGGGGQDAIVGPAAATTFTIDGADAGTVTSGGLTTQFTGIGRLQGSDTGPNQFIANAGASLSAGVFGGSAANDTLRISGDVTTASYVGTGIGSGIYTLDGRTLAYSGIETLTDNVTARTRVVTGSDASDAIFIRQDAANRITVYTLSTAPSFDSVSFSGALDALTVHGGGGADTIVLASNLRLAGATITLESELITVSGQTIDTTGGAAGIGDVNLNSNGLAATMAGNVGGLAGSITGAIASISLTNAQIRAGGAIAVVSAAQAAADVTGTGLGAAGVTPNSSVSLDRANLSASGLVSIQAHSQADVTVRVTGASVGGSADAAIAASVVDARSTLSILNSQIRSTGGAVKLSAGSIVHATTTADASSAGLGGAAANAIVTIRDGLTFAGTNQLAAATSIEASATSDVVVTTAAKAATGGTSGATPRTGALLSSGNAQTSEGAITAAAAVALNVVDGADAVDVGGTNTAAAPVSVDIASHGTEVISATADSSSANTSTGIAAAAAINKVGQTSTATISGSLTVNPGVPSAATVVNVTASEQSTVTARAISGIGSGAATGLAGAFAFNSVNVTPTASIGDAAVLLLNGASLLVSGSGTSTVTADAGAAKDAGGAGSASAPRWR